MMVFVEDIDDVEEVEDELLLIFFGSLGILFFVLCSFLLIVEKGFVVLFVSFVLV